MSKNRFANLELKYVSKEDEDAGILTGYGSKYGNLDQANDVILPGAFKKSLNDKAASGRKFPFLYQHDISEVIGVIEEIKEDEEGLLIKVQLNLDTQRGREVASLIKMGALTGLSVGFQIIKDETDSKGIRFIKEGRLLEVSAVTFPCNEEATIESIKSAYENYKAEQAADESIKEDEPMSKLKTILDLINDVDPETEKLNKEDWDIIVESLRSLVDETDEAVTESDEEAVIDEDKLDDTSDVDLEADNGDEPGDEAAEKEDLLDAEVELDEELSDDEAKELEEELSKYLHSLVVTK